MQTIEKYKNFLQLTDLQKIGSKEEASSSNQVLYYRRTWENIQKCWNPDQEYLFAFWGVNENTDRLYDLISQTYPHAKLVGVYDMFRTVHYKGFTSVNPKELSGYARSENFYVIVTAYLAARVAPDICLDCGFPMDHVFLCERDFIEAADICR